MQEAEGGGGGGVARGAQGAPRNNTGTCMSLILTTWTICDNMNSIELSIALRAVKKC